MTEKEPTAPLKTIVNMAKIAAFQEVIDDIQEPVFEMHCNYVEALTEVLEEKINELKKRDERYYL